MIVLRIIGIVLLVVLLFGVALCALLLTLTARIEVKRNAPDGPLRVRIGFGPFKYVWTHGKKKKRKKKPAKKPEAKKKPEEKKPKEPSPPRVDLKRLDIQETLSLALDLIDDMAGTMTWERLHVTVILHTSDAGRTGSLLGALSAIVGNLYPYMERAFVLKDTKIVIDADFDAQHAVWSADIAVMTRLIRFPRILWRRRKALWNLWKSIRITKEERAQWREEHAAPQTEPDHD